MYCVGHSDVCGSVGIYSERNCRQFHFNRFDLVRPHQAVFLSQHFPIHKPTILLVCLLFTGRRATHAKSDTLNVKVLNEEDSAAKMLLESELHLHQCKAERAYEQFKEDTVLSQSSHDVDMVTFDLQ